jgi:glutathione S-transferase
MACLRRIPSPWTEAAKGIFYAKGLDCQYAAQADGDPDDAIASWAGDSEIPVVAYENEPLRTGWAEILILAERLAPEPALIPIDAQQRAQLFGLSHEICGEMGVGWCVRLLMLKSGMDHSSDRTFPSEAAATLAGKYGFNPSHVRQAESRVVEVLGLLAATLGDRDYFLGDSLSALDIYWATMANLLVPLADDQLPMSSYMRGIYTSTNSVILDALTPRLRDHQQRTYDKHLELPVPL